MQNVICSKTYSVTIMCKHIHSFLSVDSLLTDSSKFISYKIFIMVRSSQ